MSEVFPADWDGPEDKNKVIRLLISLPLSPLDKKYTLFEWCKRYGVKMTGGDVARVTGRPAGQL